MDMFLSILITLMVSILVLSVLAYIVIKIILFVNKKKNKPAETQVEPKE